MILDPNSNQMFCSDIAKALGLPEYLRGFEISANVDCLVTAKCEFIVTSEQNEKIKTVLKKYKITAEEIKL